jgi:N-acyl-L-homoserine lactone synthetase
MGEYGNLILLISAAMHMFRGHVALTARCDTKRSGVMIARETSWCRTVSAPLLSANCAPDHSLFQDPSTVASSLEVNAHSARHTRVTIVAQTVSRQLPLT